MAQLTAEQVNALANDFLAVAQAIGDYRYQHFYTLTSEQQQKIRDLHWTILNYADDLYTQSAVLVMNNVQASLEKIDAVTGEIKKSYQKLKNIQKAIDVATAAATLGAALMSKSPQAVAKALEELEASWK
jgi:hypothetical protein